MKERHYLERAWDNGVKEDVKKLMFQAMPCHIKTEEESRRISHNVCNNSISFESYYSDLHYQ